MRSIGKILRVGEKTDSPIEELLYQELLKYGFTPVPQYPVGVFRIDLAFPEIKLAIEADGKDFHSTDEQKKRDAYREDKLKALGWTFERFTGQFLFKNFQVAGAKIALKYFKDKLTKEQTQYATGWIVSHFTSKDFDLAMDIVSAYPDGYIYKKGRNTTD